jgi:hypothetical protein
VNAFLANSWHYIMGLAVIGVIAALAADGTITGDIAVPIITGVGSTLIGGGLVNAATPSSTTTPPST